MQDRTFTRWLITVTISMGLLVYGLSHWAPLANHLPISFFSIAFFTGVALIAQFLGKKAAKSSNRNLLTQLVMVLVFFKLVCCLLIVIAYDRLYAPESNHYVLVFFFIYIVYLFTPQNSLGVR